MQWTEERVAELKELWSSGLSAAQIAARLGDVTRNAVIGKVHRLGLSGRPSPIRRSRPEPRPEPQPEPPPVVGIVKRPCQWPFGDPGQADFRFCGREAAPSKPYCPEHVARAYHTSSSSSENEGKVEAA
jgi:GcrA cell cycle regulator